MPYLIKNQKFINSNQGLGIIEENGIEIGLFSFENESFLIHILFLEIKKEYRGNKKLKDIAIAIKESFNKSLYFEAQDLNDPNKSNKELMKYYESIGFQRIKDNLFRF